MPTLRHLSASGIYRRWKCSHTIAPVTLFVGLNESYKTTCLGLADLVVNGPTGSTFPVLGPSPKYKWWAQADFTDDNDRTVTVRRHMNGSHGVTYNHQSGALRVLQSDIDHLLGRAGRWSLTSFLDDSPAKRLAWLQRDILQGAGWSKDAAVDAVVEVSPDVLDLLETESVSGVLRYDDGRAYLETLIAALKEKGTEHYRNARRLSNVVDHDQQTVQTENEGIVGTVASWEAKRAQIDVDIEQQAQHVGRLEGVEHARRQLQKRLEAITISIDKERRIDWAKELAMIDRRLEEQSKARADIMHQVAVMEPDGDDLTTARIDAQDLYEGRAKATAAAGEDLKRARWANNARAERQDLIEIIESLLAVAEQSDWADEEPALAEANVAVASFAQLPDRLSGAERAESHCRQQLEEAQVARVAAIEAEMEHDRLSADLQREAGAIDLRAIEEILSSATNKRETSADRIKTLNDEREEILVQLTEIGNTGVDSAEDALEVLKGQRAEAQGNIDTLTDRAQWVASRQENQAALNEAREGRTAVREALKRIEPVYQGMLAELIGTLRADVTRITESVLGAEWSPSLLGGFTFDLVRGADNLGPGSRSVQAVTMMALRLAVVQRLGGWRNLILDDMENLEPERRTLFLDAMVEECAEGRLDNFIGGCVRSKYDSWGIPDGVEAIKL